MSRTMSEIAEVARMANALRNLEDFEVRDWSALRMEAYEAAGIEWSMAHDAEAARTELLRRATMNHRAALAAVAAE